MLKQSSALQQLAQTHAWAHETLSQSAALQYCCVLSMQVNFQHVWVTFGSMLLSFTFVFGNSIKTLFESVIFLFVVHPFDVGDMISIGTTPGDPCTVRPARQALSSAACTVFAFDFIMLHLGTIRLMSVMFLLCRWRRLLC